MLGCIIMASGHAKRFGGDKLLFPLDGSPLCEHSFSAIAKAPFHTVAVVTRSDAVAALALKHGLLPVMNPDTTDDPAVTVRLGCDAMPAAVRGVAFCVADQPYLRTESLTALAEAFQRGEHRIVRLAWRGRVGNPVLFPASLLPELRSLPPGESGRYVVARHRALVLPVEAQDERELKDIDRRTDLD